jgi:glycosyltransferase involved in cell wall biosynthesis
MLISFKKLRFSVIVIQFVSLDGVAAILFKRIFRTKIILFAVGSDILKIQEHAVAYPIIRLIMKESDFIFCTSDSIQKKLETMGFSSTKMKTIPSIVNFDDVESFGVDKVFDIATVGALNSNKNQMMLIEACAYLPSVRVVIIGDGSSRSILESKSKQSKVNVIFLGEISHKQVLKELQKSRIYVQTSVSEGSPVAVFEAMFLGLPLVLVDRPYVNDLHDKYGFEFRTVKDNSVEDLANTLFTMLNCYESERQKTYNNKNKLQSIVHESSIEIKEVLEFYALRQTS